MACWCAVDSPQGNGKAAAYPFLFPQAGWRRPVVALLATCSRRWLGERGGRAPSKMNSPVPSFRGWVAIRSFVGATARGPTCGTPTGTGYSTSCSRTAPPSSGTPTRRWSGPSPRLYFDRVAASAPPPRARSGWPRPSVSVEGCGPSWGPLVLTSVDNSKRRWSRCQVAAASRNHNQLKELLQALDKGSWWQKPGAEQPATGDRVSQCAEASGKDTGAGHVARRRWW